jgi:RimJ/RimL family protein N-acetyltransferase
MTLTANHFINEDLSLTEIRTSDKASIVKHINDKAIHKNTIHIPFPYFDRDADDFLANCRKFEDHFKHVGQFAMRLKGEMVGGIGFLYTHGEASHKAEIGYWIGKEHRGKGITTLAIKKIVDIGFGEKGLFRLEANVFLDNHASMKALKKAGFEKEGLLKSTFIKGDRLVDTYLYSCVKDIK